MKLESQVCSLELAKRLKELGVKQESFFEWTHHFDVGKTVWEILLTDPRDIVNEKCAAFTVAELGEMLPQNVEGKDLESRRYESSQWRVWYQPRVNSSTDIFAVSKTEADARAKMLIHLIENKLVKS